MAGRGVVLLAVLLGAFVPAGPSSGTTPGYRALVFTKTAGFRHDSIEEAVAALQTLASERGFEITHTEDAAAFTDPGLSGYHVVVFLLTTGDVLSPAEESGLQAFVRQGGGFVGVHSASDTEHAWPWYGGLVGAFFVSHSTIQSGVVRVTDRRHGSTRDLSSRLPRTDEWYDFDRNPRDAVHVLASVSERSYQGGRMGSDHPVSWCHRFQGGRSWYTAMGHTEQTYMEGAFLEHLAGGLDWAAGAVPGNCSPRTDAEVLTVRFDRGAVEGGLFTDRRACRARRPIEIMRVRPGTDPLVGRSRTDRDGDWRRPGFEGAAGRFRARAEAVTGCRRLRSAQIVLG
ncbi:MAG: ThuA domain-containing protein [Actinomycetota bacterium]